MEEYSRDGKWTVRIGDHVKVSGEVSEQARRYFGNANLGFKGTLLRLTVQRDGKVVAHVTDSPVRKKGEARRIRTVNAERLTKTNVV